MDEPKWMIFKLDSTVCVALSMRKQKIFNSIFYLIQNIEDTIEYKQNHFIKVFFVKMIVNTLKLKII